MFTLLCWGLFPILIYLFIFPFLVYRRPTALQDRMRDSDDDDLHDRDYDVAALANNLSQAFRYKIYGNEDNEEVCSCWLLFLSVHAYLLISVCVFLSPFPFFVSLIFLFWVWHCNLNSGLMF